jgi:hypothetical protein
MPDVYFLIRSLEHPLCCGLVSLHNDELVVGKLLLIPTKDTKERQTPTQLSNNPSLPLSRAGRAS